MPAFHPYAGAYEIDGARYGWRCYATARVYDVREQAHGPLPVPPVGKKWSVPADTRAQRPDVRWLVDEGTGEFSQILLQVEPEIPAARRA